MTETNAAPNVLDSDTGRAVQIFRVRKTYSQFVAVSDVSLKIEKGEFVTLLGPSGCGKSTLLGMIAGFVSPTAGKIIVDEVDITQVEPYRRDIGMVFQNYALFPHMNVLDNIAFGLRMRDLPKARIRDEVARVIDMMKLGGFEQRRVRELSGGQQQRVALARAIVIRPKVLLLDEPLSALDKNLRNQMQIELSELHRKTGLTTIFVTHDQGEALSLSDRIVVMNRGEVQQVARPAELYRTPANGFVASFIGEINALPPAVVKRTGGIVELTLPGGIKLQAPLQPHWKLTDGQKVRALLRPEKVSPVADGIAAPNVIHGRVVTHIYQGSHTITRAEIDTIGVIEMRVSGDGVISDRPVGAPISLRLDLDEAILLDEASA